MADKINPYIAGAPVVEKRMFFGRQDVFSWIEMSLSGKYVDHILVLHGQRRVGKTSVLKHLSDHLPDRYISIFIDLQGRVSTSLDRFLWWLAREITRALAAHGLDTPKTEREAFSQDPEYFETVFLPQIEQTLGERRLLLTFDEFDSLETTAAQDGLALPFMAILRRLMNHKQINFIFSIGSSGHKLENMQAAYTGFFKQALYKKISFLDPEDARNLITRPVENILTFSSQAVEDIIEVTSGHPYFIQLVCHELFSQCQKMDEWQVDCADVQAILPAVIERGTVNLKFVWDEANEIEKWVLAALAHHDELDSLDKVEKYLKQQKVRFVRRDLEAALLHLREKDVLTAGNKYVIYLLKLWLMQNRPMEQVREELTATNPIVNRLLEIGHEYLESEQFQRARQSFNEALEHDADHYEARLGLAETYLRMGDHGQAAADFERLLESYPDDVAAQSGYCNAYLALGDYHRALGEIDEADYAYQQVLKVNPEHQQGLQRMAGVHHYRAVKAIVGGEQASLQEMEKAVQFAPDDPLLQKSLNQLKDFVERRVDRLEVLRSWGHLARQAEFLDEAIELFGAYIGSGGERKDVLELIDDLRELDRRRKSDVLRTRAEQMETLGHKPQALTAWREYLALNPQEQKKLAPVLARLEESSPDFKQEAGRPLWKRLWLWLAVGAVLVLTTMFIFPGSPLNLINPASPVAEQPPVTPSALPVLIATENPMPGPTQEPTTVPMPQPTAIPLRWSRINSGLFLERDTVTSIVVDYKDADIMYIGTLNGGIYKTIDGGISWSPINAEGVSANITSIVMDLEDSETLLVAASDKVFKTTDGGLTWSNSSIGLNFPDWDVEGDLKVDPFDADTYYFNGAFVLDRSEDDGQYWNVIAKQNSGCPGSFVDFVLDQAVPNIVYTIEGSGTDCEIGIYRSVDAGETWELFVKFPNADFTWGGKLLTTADEGRSWLYVPMREGLLRISGADGSLETVLEGTCEPVGVDREDAGMIYCTAGELLMRSRNDARLWGDLHVFPERISAFAISPLDSETFFVGTSGISLSEDDGKSWTALNNGLGANHYELVFDPAVSGTVYIYEQGNLSTQDVNSQLYRSTDFGRSWELVTDRGLGLWIDPAGEVMYRYEPYDDRRTGILTSRDGGKTWKRQALEISNLSQLATHPYQSGLVMAYGSTYREGSTDPVRNAPILLYSEDFGDTWQEATGLSVFAHYTVEVARLFFDPLDGNRAYLVSEMGNRAVYSEDRGKSWKICGMYTYSGDPAGSGTRLAISPDNAEQLFIATRGSGVITSNSGCRTWSIQKSLIGNLYVNTVAINPDDPDVIYAGTDGGVYISFDAGQTWGTVNDGLLGSLTIYSIVIDPHDHSNILAATPYGIFRLETP